MSGSPVEIVEHERRFPAGVEAALAERHAAVIASVEGGRVLDLDDRAARSLLAAALDAGDSVGPAPARFDAVVSVAQLVRFPDLAGALAAIDRLLAPTGRLLAVEPVAKPGTVRLFTAAPFALARSTRGLHLGRDLPAALRTTSLVIDDIERFTVPTALPTLRHFVAIDARRAAPRQEMP